MTIFRATYDQLAGGRRTLSNWAGSGSSGGYVVPVIPKTDMNINANAGGANSVVVTLAQGIDSTAWVSGVLVVRYHTRGTFTATNATVTVDNCSIVDDDPSVIFATGTPISTSTAFTSASPVPFLSVTALSAPIGPQLRVLLNVNQGTVGNNIFSLSVDLIGRPA